MSGGYISAGGVLSALRLTFDRDVSLGWFAGMRFAFGAVTGDMSDMSCIALDPADTRSVLVDMTCGFPGATLPASLGADSKVTITFTAPWGWSPLVVTIIDNVVGVLTRDRVIPDFVPDKNVSVVNPISSVGFKFTAGPNPVSKSTGQVGFFVGATVPGRPIATWDLRNAKGRPVPSGTYLVRGTVSVNGKRERVSAMIGIR